MDSDVSTGTVVLLLVAVRGVGGWLSYQFPTLLGAAGLAGAAAAASASRASAASESGSD